MIIIYGHRDYGRVDGHDGEYVATKFAHLYWLPLVPTGSHWVTREVGDQRVGFDVKLSGRSVAAAYLRMWAPIFAIIAGATRTIPGFAIAALLLGLSVWSWTWRRAVRGREARRALFNLVAFGTACDPLRRPTAQCEMLRADAEAQFAAHSEGRNPDDVARFGAANPSQAAFAYAVLRVVAGSARGDAARKARAASERILDGLKDGDAGALADGGPFRASDPAAAAAADADLRTAAAAAVSARQQALDDAPPRTDAAWANDPNNPAVQAEIAANKRAGVNKLGIGAIVVAGVAFAGYAGYSYWQERRAASDGMDVLRQVTDDICACRDRECVRQVFDTRGDQIDRAEKAAVDVKANRDVVESLGSRISACIDSLPED